METPLLWIDVETSGLSPLTNSLLEVALVATDENLTVQDSVSYVIKQSRPVIWDMPAREMHQNNGLIRALDSAELSLTQVEEALVKWVGDRFDGRQMAGSSCQSIDRPFLDRYMPLLASKFSYRNFDVRTLRTFFSVNTGASVSHRALDDIISDLSLTKGLLVALP